MEVRALMRSLFFNLLLAAGVFLPTFLIASAVELRLRGGPPLQGDFSYQAASAAVIYLTMLFPVLLGAFLHTVSMIAIPPTWRSRRRRAAAVALATLVPLTAIVLRLPGANPLSFFLAASGVATVAYGVMCTTRVGRRLRIDEGGVAVKDAS